MSRHTDPYRIPLRAVMTRRDWAGLIGVSVFGAIAIACRVLAAFMS